MPTSCRSCSTCCGGHQALDVDRDGRSKISSRETRSSSIGEQPRTSTSASTAQSFNRGIGCFSIPVSHIVAAVMDPCSTHWSTGSNEGFYPGRLWRRGMRERRARRHLEHSGLKVLPSARDLCVRVRRARCTKDPATPTMVSTLSAEVISNLGLPPTRSRSPSSKTALALWDASRSRLASICANRDGVYSDLFEAARRVLVQEAGNQGLVRQALRERSLLDRFQVLA